MDREAKTARTRAAAKPAPARRPRKATPALDARSNDERLADALAQQAATAGILRVMAASPTDAQPVPRCARRRCARAKARSAGWR